jgi:IclR family KDG regulon transcriptional repressor
MPRQKQADKNFIAVLGKAFTVVEYLIESGNEREPVAFTEIFKELPFSRTTVHRILYSLEKLGYVEKDDVTSYYRLTAKFFNLTGPIVHFQHLQSVAKPVLQNLVFSHAETSSLAVIENGQITYIDVHQSPSALRFVSSPGDRNPVHCTALGKAILAFLPQSELNAILNKHPFVTKTPKTITSKTRFLKHLASVREQGVAFDMEENSNGVICIAAPIFDRTGQVFAACSMSGPTTRMTPKLNAVKNDIRAAALTITRMLSPLSKLAESPKSGSNDSRPWLKAASRQIVRH